MFLPSLISLRRPTDHVESPEDILSSSLSSLFTDDVRNQHGDDPDTIVVYHSRKFGDIELRTADVSDKELIYKFAHCLWNAGILMTELVSGKPGNENASRDLDVHMGQDYEEGDGGNQEWWVPEEEEELWGVKGETVLEFGAGVGLAAIASVLAGAEEVTTTDYPEPVILDAINTNIYKNIPDTFQAKIQIKGHQWGQLDTPFAQANAHRFTRILAADCLWKPDEHENLAQSMLHFLSLSPNARVFCIAGFHTNRVRMAPFFEKVVPTCGLEIENIYEMDANGVRRPWKAKREGVIEDVGERNKWLVVARLKWGSDRRHGLRS